MTKLEKWNNDTYDLWEVGFKLVEASEESYKYIDSIEVSLYKDNNKIASRRTVDGGVEELMKDDIFYGGLNGSLSCSFKERSISECTRYWDSTPYDFTKPDKAEVRASILNKENNITAVYVVEIQNIITERPKLICIK